MPSDPLQILEKVFGYSAFRLHQQAIIRDALQGKDVFVLMPTGGGKSLCYQVPALAQEGVVIVVSPLIALMKDQVDALRNYGIAAAYLNSTQSVQEQRHVLDGLAHNTLKLCYIAPERLSGDHNEFIAFMKRLNISLIAIDEAHCISQWGHDFRPDYLALKKLRETFPEIPIMALTASADEHTREDIIQQLRLREPGVYISSFDRPNISYTILPRKDMKEDIARYILEHEDDSGIIYCLSRKDTEQMAAVLQEYGISAGFYHAGMSTEERSKTQDDFIKDRTRVMVATIAFGMGIDKSNVRYVIHASLPKNIESYYQETGRAGRDGLKSDAVLYYSRGDIMRLKRFISGEENKEQYAIALKKLMQMADLAESMQCRRQYLLNYFGEAHPGNCGNCDFCQREKDVWDATVPAQKILSAVTRLEEKFGAKFIADFLRGSRQERITDTMRSLKTYGIGKEFSVQEWIGIIRQLITQGWIMQEEGMYPILKLTPASADVLSGKTRVFLLKQKATEKPVQEKTQEEYDPSLFSELKKLRKIIADSEGMPAYIVLSDATLTELSTYYPQSKTALAMISGFGEYKVEKYGAEVLELINRYCSEHGLSSRIHLRPRKRLREKKEPAFKGNSALLTLQLFREGKPVPQIAAIRNMSVETVFSHLVEFIPEGEVQLSDLVPEEKVKEIRKAIEKTGISALKPIRETLGENYAYGEIKAVIRHDAYL